MVFSFLDELMNHKFLAVAQKVKNMAALTKSEKEAIKHDSKAHLKEQKQQVIQEVNMTLNQNDQSDPIN